MRLENKAEDKDMNIFYFSIFWILCGVVLGIIFDSVFLFIFIPISLMVFLVVFNVIREFIITEEVRRENEEEERIWARLKEEDRG